jgi:hypothetical protein
LNGAIWLLFFRDKGPAGSRAVSTVIQTTVVAAAKPVARIVVRTNAFDWRQLESEDYRTYINRLRTIGCPEETIRDIVIADLEKLMAPEVKGVDGRREPPKYWEPKQLTRTLDSLEKIGKKQEIDFRKREVIRELLGIDLASERSRVKGESDFYEERLSFLSTEKQMRVRMALEKANREETVLRENSWLENDQFTASEREQLREIQNRKEAQVAEVLSPEELEQYNLWFSPSAYRVRDAFLALEPNEDDFLALYRIQREFDTKWSDVDPATLSAAEKREYQEAQKQYDDQIREHLGPERFEKFLLTREPDFQRLQDTVTQFGLNPAAVEQVFGFKKALQEEKTKISQNGVIPLEQKREILKALAEETEAAVVEVIGPKPYRYFVRSGAGKWIWE